MNKQVFYDPQRKRWKRLRRVTDSLALGGVVLGLIFLFGLVRMKPMRASICAPQRRNTTRFPTRRPTNKNQGSRSTARPTARPTSKPSDVLLNSGEGLRAAYYTDSDPASYSSLKQHIKQIDLLFPEWLHVVTPDGKHDLLHRLTTCRLPLSIRPASTASTMRTKSHAPSLPPRSTPKSSRWSTTTTPTEGVFDPTVGDFLSTRLARQLPRAGRQLSSPRTRTIAASHSTSRTSRRGPTRLRALMQALYDDFHPRNLRLYINMPVGDDELRPRSSSPTTPTACC